MKINKGKLSLICAFICAAVIISVASAFSRQATKDVVQKAIYEENSKELTAKAQYALNSTYIIKEHNGNIGIFSSEGELINTINVAVITLPIEERQRINNGIKVTSEKELYSIIEDYTG